MEFNINDTIKQVLTKVIGQEKPVTIVLTSGNKYKCTVKAVGQHCANVVVAQTFTPVIIQIASISAIEY